MSQPANDPHGNGAKEHIYKRRQSDKGWLRLVTGIPLAFTLLSIVGGGVVGTTTLYWTVQAQGRSITTQAEGDQDREKRIQALERHQAVTSHRLNSIHKEQLRQRAEAREATKLILDALRRQRDRPPPER